jgi:hypothetical protein
VQPNEILLGQKSNCIFTSSTKACPISQDEKRRSQKLFNHTRELWAAFHHTCLQVRLAVIMGASGRDLYKKTTRLRNLEKGEKIGQSPAKSPWHPSKINRNQPLGLFFPSQKLQVHKTATETL